MKRFATFSLLIILGSVFLPNLASAQPVPFTHAEISVGGKTADQFYDFDGDLDPGGTYTVSVSMKDLNNVAVDPNLVLDQTGAILNGSNVTANADGNISIIAQRLSSGGTVTLTVSQGGVPLISGPPVNYPSSSSGATPTTTTVTAVSPSNPYPNPTYYRDVVLFTATVTPSTASGTVTFMDGATPINVIPEHLALGIATFSTDARSGQVSSHSITAIYSSANSDYAGSTSTAVTLTIDPKPITVTADAKSKTYGDADPTFTYTNIPALLGTDAFTGTLTRATDENVGTYAIQEGSLSAGGNYVLTYVPANLTISPKPITITADAKSKTYGDGDPALTYTPSPALLGSDAFTGALIRATGENVGTYAIQLGSLTAGGNYALSIVPANLTINKRAITVTADAKTKSYGDLDPALTYQVTIGSLAFSDAFTGALSRVAGENAGAYAIQQGTLALNANYDLAYGGANLTINKRAITVTADAKTKTYGDADPPLTYQVTSGSLAFSDAFTGALSRVAGENAGASYAIQQGTLALNANYDLAYGGANLTINKRAITVTADAKTKTYGDADPPLTYQVTSGSLAFSDAFSGALSRVAGEDASTYAILQGSLALSTNYNLTYVGANLTISQKTVTPGIIANNKVYDGNNSATIASSSITGKVPSDDVALSGGTATFSDKNVGTGKTVTATGLSLSGAKASNYVLASTSATTTANITAHALTVTATGVNKVYDGTTAATVTLSDNRLPGDVFNDAYASASFADANVGTGKTVTVTGISIAGTDAGNYTLTSTTASTTANITTHLSSTAVASSAATSVYGVSVTFTATVTGNGGSPTGTVTFTDGVSTILGTATLSGGTASITTSTLTVGSHSVTAAYSGDGNYSASASTVAVSQTITPATVTPGITANDKVYDGNNSATIAGRSLTGVVNSDDVTLTGGTATFSDKKAGIGKTVTATGLSLIGAKAPNYVLASTSATTTANITAHALTVTATGVNKVYDGTTTATVTLSDNRLSGDVFDDAYASASFADANVGASKPVNVTGISISGTDAVNYALTSTSASTTANITAHPSSTTVASSAATSVYGVSVTFTAKVTGNGASPTGTVTFKDGASTILAPVALSGGVASITISALTVGSHSVTAAYGGDGNYDPSSSAALSQTITPATVTPSITASNKVYDGNNSATISGRSLTGVVNSDDVALSGGTATFSDKNVGTGKTVTATGLSLIGAKAPNYVLASTSATTTANITALALTVTATGVNKVYDGTTAATVTLSDNRLSGDVLTDTYTSASFADPNVGTGKTVNVTGISISGTDAGNYALASTTATTTADITAAPANSGAIAGAGYVSSPAGAFVKTPTFTGRGYFAFAAAYIGRNPVTPTGLVEYLLKSKSLFGTSVMKFSSSQFESLVVSGSQATLKGTGTVDGSGSYGFLLSVIDGQLFAGNKLRIKIWDKIHGGGVTYDNQMGASDNASPTGAVTGLISVSKSGGSTTSSNVSVQQVIEEEAATEIPTQYELYNAYPNPFNPSTTIRFDLPDAGRVRLVVYDMLGREAAVLVDEERPAGQHAVKFDAGKLSSGVYIYRLQAGNFVQTKKLMLMK